MIVLALIRDRQDRARISGALRGRESVCFCERQQELSELARAGDVAAIITEAQDAAGIRMAPFVRRLRDAYPSVPVLAYCSLCADLSRDIADLVRAGANELIIRGRDDVGVTLRATLMSAKEHCTTERVMFAVGEALPRPVREIVEFCLANASRVRTVEEVAIGLGVNRRTLANRLSVLGAAPPSEIVGWCRLLQAARMLEDRGRSVEEVALALDFSSATGLRNMFRRYMGRRPSQIRESDGFGLVLRSFRGALDRAADPSGVSANEDPDRRLRLAVIDSEPVHRAARLF